MLHDKLAEYLRFTEAAIQPLKESYIEKYEEEILTENRLNLRIRIRFVNGHLLEINEAVIVENNKLMHISYRYHFQDKNNKLLFRYDNTPHFPDFKSFPHHKHLPGKIVDSKQPSIHEVVKEVKKLV